MAFKGGAEGGSRTPTGLPLLGPEPSASAYSATSAINFDYKAFLYDFEVSLSSPFFIDN